MLGAAPNFHRIPALSRVVRSPLRTALALGSALALAGCGGGGSDSMPTPPAPTLAAPANFMLQDLADFSWSATPGATYYELYADPDGPGPQPEAKVNGFNPGLGVGFQYVDIAPQGFTGVFYSGAKAPAMTALLNSSYRLRACDVKGCGAFTEPKVPNVANAFSHEFSSGRAPFKSSIGLDGTPRLSRDALTLALRASDGSVYVFTRDTITQPWQVHAEVTSGNSDFARHITLSADGGTLAVAVNEPHASDPTILEGVVHVHKRNGNAWTRQAVFQAPGAPPTCPQPCRASVGDVLSLSADGNLLAASVNYSISSGSTGTSTGTFKGSAVATYTRDGATWAQQSLLETGGKVASSLTLSSDGSTLAVNEDALDTREPQLTATTPFVRIYAKQGGSWTQQARMPVGIVTNINGSLYSAMALSGDGNTLAVHALNVPKHQTPELDIQSAELSCGAMVDNWYIALYTRNGTTWQRQTAISRGLTGKWAIAPDGNGLFYGNALFKRSSTTWACP